MKSHFTHRAQRISIAVDKCGLQLCIIITKRKLFYLNLICI